MKETHYSRHTHAINKPIYYILLALDDCLSIIMIMILIMIMMRIMIMSSDHDRHQDHGSDRYRDPGLCCAVPWRAVSCRAVRCRAVSCRAVPCRAVPCRVVVI